MSSNLPEQALKKYVISGIDKFYYLKNSHLIPSKTYSNSAANKNIKTEWIKWEQKFTRLAR